MWVLSIEGQDDDYAASVFERSKWTVEEALEDPDGLKEFLSENGCEYAEVSVYEFDDVDPDFVDLAKSFIDYDYSKQSNFYCYWE